MSPATMGCRRFLTLGPLAAVAGLVLTGLFFGTRSLQNPAAVSAQGFCSSGAIGTTCAGSGYQYCADNGIQIVPDTESCGNPVSYTCNGLPYSAPVACNAAGSGCSFGVASYGAQACGATAGISGQYNGVYPATTAPSLAPTYGGTAFPLTITAATAPAYSGPPSLPAAAPVASASYGTAVYPSASVGLGFAVNYAAGWNLVAGPSGTVLGGTVGALYTIGPGDTTYRILPPGSALTSGAGAWAYFTGNTSTSIALTNSASLTVPLPAGQFVLIGNPGDTTAAVSGADEVLVYDPSSSSYQQSTYLVAGEGAWAVSLHGGQATLSNAPAARGQQQPLVPDLDKSSGS